MGFFDTVVQLKKSIEMKAEQERHRNEEQIQQDIENAKRDIDMEQKRIELDKLLRQKKEMQRKRIGL